MLSANWCSVDDRAGSVAGVDVCNANAPTTTSRSTAQSACVALNGCPSSG